MGKTKQEILKMNNQELEKYRWSEELDIKEEGFNCPECFECTRCSGCSNCSRCTGCFDCAGCFKCTNCYDCYNSNHCFNCFSCFHCSYCRNANGLKYAIGNVEMLKSEYFAKIKELKAEPMA